MTIQEAQAAFDCAEPGSVQAMECLNALLQAKAQEHQAGIEKRRQPIGVPKPVTPDAPSRQTEMDI